MTDTTAPATEVHNTYTGEFLTVHPACLAEARAWTLAPSEMGGGDFPLANTEEHPTTNLWGACSVCNEMLTDPASATGVGFTRRLISEAPALALIDFLEAVRNLQAHREGIPAWELDLLGAGDTLADAEAEAKATAIVLTDLLTVEVAELALTLLTDAAKGQRASYDNLQSEAERAIEMATLLL